MSLPFSFIQSRVKNSKWLYCAINAHYSNKRQISLTAAPSSTSLKQCAVHFLRRRKKLSVNNLVQNSSSDVYQHLHNDFHITNAASAQELVNHFTPEERALLLSILSVECKKTKQCPLITPLQPHDEQIFFWQLKQLFIINTIPFIGFGILDNMIMLLAGEYIDQTIGAVLGISTMAAAALGNIISDVAGVGLAHYVEILFSRLGFKHPDLTPKQLDSKRVRFSVNMSRAFGLVVGCFIGMFPLLFFKSNTEKANSKD